MIQTFIPIRNPFQSIFEKYQQTILLLTFICRKLKTGSAISLHQNLFSMRDFYDEKRVLNFSSTELKG
ncbi:hypothetical protein LEP1GSC060_2972 [Leptospira weilii serovar Ranarum str. ICFT]|uniref:Uncharacterized protein n=1 Tax=Leptospira weilii serovar Ranarum str. ICFT TaxID=1218598 RepID=N1WER8_9LEPT|nr:hypothetical protein LEP1GSC060_2972 [Leptospira weilii serovar Ranarum str. ICFT]